MLFQTFQVHILKLDFLDVIMSQNAAPVQLKNVLKILQYLILWIQFPEKKGKPPAYQQLIAAVPVFKLTLIEATPMQACGIMIAADRKTLCPASCLTQAIRKLSKRQ